MAKSTKAQEVSTGTSDSYTPEELADPAPPVRIQRAMLGVVPEEVPPSVGTHSSQSSESETTRNDNENPSLRQPAPTTENPSGQPAKETDSTADSTVGDGLVEEEHQPFDEDDDEEETPRSSSKKSTAAKKSTTPARKKANTRNTDDEFSEFE